MLWMCKNGHVFNKIKKIKQYGLKQSFKLYKSWHPKIMKDFIYRTINKIRTEPIQIKTKEGFDLLINPKDMGLSWQLFLFGYREPECVKYFKTVLKHLNNPKILDIGSNIGCYVIFESLSINGGIIHAVEPHPDNFLLLLKNLKLNNIKNVIPYNLAIANEKIVKLYYGNSLNQSSLVKRREINQSNHITVPAISLNDFFKFFDDSINYIRMDIEGYEYEVITLSNVFNQIDGLYIELHPSIIRNRGLKVETIFDKLFSSGLSLKYIVKENAFYEEVPFVADIYKTDDAVNFLKEKLGKKYSWGVGIFLERD